MLLASLLTIGLFLIFLALDAYFIVLRDSSIFESLGLAHAIIVVLLLPPKLSCKILVNLLSRYGINYVPAAIFFSSVKAAITLPKASKPLFMLIPSYICLPTAPVFFMRSLPAKSTK
jgi:hypothetical protein